MSNDTGAIARQRHYTTLRNVDREVLRQTWSIGYVDPGFTTQFGTPPEPSPHHAATSFVKIVTDTTRFTTTLSVSCRPSPLGEVVPGSEGPGVIGAQHPKLVGE
ncbi:DUF6349 family protein [Streptomyces prunicolor]|uniref:DUF6349 family protein n=1 Tax=Streptomyces prunicolor TaxID=67348 RepID=UPI0033900D3F